MIHFKITIFPVAMIYNKLSFLETIIMKRHY